MRSDIDLDTLGAQPAMLVERRPHQALQRPPNEVRQSTDNASFSSPSRSSWLQVFGSFMIFVNIWYVSPTSPHLTHPL